MKYFPDMSKYDIGRPSGMALYCAHMDLDPIGGLIEYTNISQNSYHELFGHVIKRADDVADFKTSSETMDEMVVYSSRIIPLEYNAILLMMMSCLEEGFNTWCRLEEGYLRKNGNFIVSLSDYVPKKKGDHGIEKACAYLKEYAHVTDIKQDHNWGYIDAIRTARNMLVHNGGRVVEKYREKMNQYEIGMREEDYGVYIDYQTIKKMHDAIIEFIDRVFISNQNFKDECIE